MPLILPLGEGYSLPYLGRALGDPEKAGLLPPVPYGWQGSCLPVAEPLLAAMLDNLAAGMREDDTRTGAYGAGSLATVENGKIWLETAISEKASHVNEIIDQHILRHSRRKERGTTP